MFSVISQNFTVGRRLKYHFSPALFLSFLNLFVDSAMPLDAKAESVLTIQCNAISCHVLGTALGI